MEGFINQESLPIPCYIDVFKRLNEISIYSFYINNLILNGLNHSPIGIVDNNPSLSVFWNNSKNKYFFKDFRYGYIGDCIDLVRYIFNYPSNRFACMRIMYDFKVEGYKIYDFIKLNSNNRIFNKTPYKVNTKVTIKINPVIRKWNNNDLSYWKSYGISLKYLKLGNIFPISYYYLNGNLKMADDYSYCYVENKDNIITYKIYQPFNKNEKWLNNSNHSIWDLWNLLPKTHDKLIITKSRKDALSIIENCKIPCTSLQSESTLPKSKIIRELQSRFNNIYLLYDNDFDKEVNWGQQYASKLIKLYNFKNIIIPKEYNSKDFSDLYKNLGKEKSIEIFNNLILNKK